MKKLLTLLFIFITIISYSQQREAKEGFTKVFSATKQQELSEAWVNNQFEETITMYAMPAYVPYDENQVRQLTYKSKDGNVYNVWQEIKSGRYFVVRHIKTEVGEYNFKQMLILGQSFISKEGRIECDYYIF